MAIYNMGVLHPRLEFVKVEIWITFSLLGHNIGSTYATTGVTYLFETASYFLCNY